MKNEIEKAIEEAFGSTAEPTDNSRAAEKILDEIVEGLNSLFDKNKVRLKAQRCGDKVWALGGCSLYGDKHLVMKVGITISDDIFLDDGNGNYTYLNTGDEARRWVVNYFKNKKGGALVLRSIMCMSKLKEKKEND